MKQYFVISATSLLLLSSCGNSNKNREASLNDKKTELVKLREDKEKLDAKIKNLETEVGKLDTSAAAVQKAKLVSMRTLQPTVFSHFIELQGRIDAENISYIAPSGAPGLV